MIQPFAPSVTQNVQFQATFDGSLYNVAIPWQLFGARWYFAVTDLSGNPIIANSPLIGSPDPWALTALVWNNGVVTAQITGPLTLRPGAVIDLTVSGCQPTGFNYAGPCEAINRTTFTYPVTSNPGALATLGYAAYLVNLLDGFFQTSTMVFYSDSAQIVVSP